MMNDLIKWIALNWRYRKRIWSFLVFFSGFINFSSVIFYILYLLNFTFIPVILPMGEEKTYTEAWRATFWTPVWANTCISILSTLYYVPSLKKILVLSDLHRLMAIFLYFPILCYDHVFLNCGQLNYIRICASMSLN